MASELSAMLDECPIIAAVKNEAGLEQCLQSEIQLVFILYGSVCEIPAIVQQVKNAGRSAVVHVDLISGLSPREAAVDFIRQYTRASSARARQCSAGLKIWALPRCSVFLSLTLWRWKMSTSIKRTPGRILLRCCRAPCRRFCKSSAARFRPPLLRAG